MSDLITYKLTQFLAEIAPDSALLLVGISGTISFVLSVLFAAVTIIVGFALSKFVKTKVFPKLIAMVEKRNLAASKILLEGFTQPTARTLRVVSIFLGLYVGFGSFVGVFALLLIRISVIVGLTMGFWNSAEISSLLLRGASKHLELEESKTISTVLVKVYRAIVAIFAIIILMGEFNFEITGLITSLGIVGLTISLAAQDSASNLFAGLLILLERPFNVGDWISVTGTEGIVEDITFRSTKIRALDNSLYVLPNASVCGATINNGTNREKRMYRFTLGVTYDTTRPQIEKLMADIEAMLKAYPHAIPDSALVRLIGFGDSSIDLLVNCYLDLVDLPEFLGAQNELHLNIMDIMAANGTSFAFPSTSVYLEKNEKK